MQIVIYFLAAALFLWGAAYLVVYKRTRHHGVFLLGLTYAASGVLAVVLAHWWPLVAGIVLAWVLRLLGLDPDVQKSDPGDSVKEQ